MHCFLIQVNLSLLRCWIALFVVCLMYDVLCVVYGQTGVDFVVLNVCCGAMKGL
jgi:hypothetical protein